MTGKNANARRQTFDNALKGPSIPLRSSSKVGDQSASLERAKVLLQNLFRS